MKPRPEAVTAYLHLAERLDRLDDHDTRHEAALACLGCPALAPCLTYAETAHEPHHVWGGRDRAPDRRKTPRKEMAS